MSDGNKLRKFLCSNGIFRDSNSWTSSGMSKRSTRLRIGNEKKGNMAEWLRRLSVKQLRKSQRFESFYCQCCLKSQIGTNKMRILKENPILSIVNGMLVDLPAPSNIS